MHISRKDQKRVQISDKKRHRNSDDAHWVFTLSGLISGPYYGRYFFLLWFQRHRFQLGDVAVLYMLGFHIKVPKLSLYAIGLGNNLS